MCVLSDSDDTFFSRLHTVHSRAEVNYALHMIDLDQRIKRQIM